MAGFYDESQQIPPTVHVVISNSPFRTVSFIDYHSIAAYREYTSLMNSRYQSQPSYQAQLLSPANRPSFQEWRVGLKYELYARLR